MTVRAATPEDRDSMVDVWVRSVKATHHFLPEGWVDEHTALVASLLAGDVSLHVIPDDAGDIAGFLGMIEDRIEMLFVDPDWFRQGVGSALIRYACSVLGARAVTVNEQNPEAVAFYEHHGFRVVSRSEEDGMGNPFPLLHMERS